MSAWNNTAKSHSPELLVGFLKFYAVDGLLAEFHEGFIEFSSHVGADFDKCKVLLVGIAHFCTIKTWVLSPKNVLLINP